MHVKQAFGPCPLMQIIHILGDDQQITAPFAVKIRQRQMRRVGPYVLQLRATLIIKTMDETSVAPQRLWRADVFHPVKNWNPHRISAFPITYSIFVRNVGIPDSAERPAPVKITIFWMPFIAVTIGHRRRFARGAKYVMHDNDESPAPTLRHDIMDLFDTPPPPMDRLQLHIDPMGLPSLIASVPAEDRTELGLDRPFALYPERDRSPAAIVAQVAKRMLKSMNLRRSNDDQLDDDAEVFPDFQQPELLKSVNDFREAVEAFKDTLPADQEMVLTRMSANDLIEKS